MRTRVVSPLAPFLALALGACSWSSEASGSAPAAGSVAATHGAVAAPFGVECPCCYTIIEYIRTGPRHQSRERVQVQCERCCEVLTFTTAPSGQLMVATSHHPEPVPCDLAAPAPMR